MRTHLALLLFLAACGDSASSVDAMADAELDVVGVDAPAAEVVTEDATAVDSASAETSPPDGVEPAELPVPVDLEACQIIDSGALPDDTNESSGLAALPGLKTAGDKDLLVTHGDKGLTLDFVDAAGQRDGRVKVVSAGDFEAVTVISVTGSAAAATVELAALESPGNDCTRGEGVCTDGHVLRFKVAAQPGSYTLLGAPQQWSLPKKERTNSECLEWTGQSLLLFAKNTADKYRVHLEDGAVQAVLEPLVKAKSTDAQGRLTDLTHDPVSGRLLATATTDDGAILVEIDPGTFAPTHLTPIPPPLAFEKVEGIAVFADQTIAITTEAGSIRRYRCF